MMYFPRACVQSRFTRLPTAAIRASAHPGAATVPIVAQSANAFADDVRNLFRRPMVEIVKRSKRGEKTVNMRELMRDLTVTDGPDEVTAVVTTAAGNNNMSPEYLTRAIRQYLPQYEIPFSAYHRMNVFTSDGTPFR